MEWLDGARFADTNGFQNDFARIMWPWRDWVIAAFNRNQPFDRFLIEQIAGDLLPGATLAQRIATGFNRNNRTVTEAGSIDEEWRIENAVDRVETTATVFLGLDDGLRPLPRPQVRPDLAGRVLPVPRLLQQRQRARRVHRNARQCAAADPAADRPEDDKRLKELETALAAAKKRGDKKEVDKLAKEKEAIREGDHQRDGDGRHSQAAADVSCSNAAGTTCRTRARPVEPGVPASSAAAAHRRRAQPPRAWPRWLARRKTR